MAGGKDDKEVGDVKLTTWSSVSKSGDLLRWLDRFQLICRLRKIKDRAAYLPLHLDGAAFEVYHQLTDEEKNNYDKIVSTLREAFCLNCYSAYEKLQVRRLQPGEEVDVYLSDLRRLFSLVEGASYSEAGLKCAFMSGLPKTMKDQLKSLARVESMNLQALTERARALLPQGEDRAFGSDGLLGQEVVSGGAGVFQSKGGSNRMKPQGRAHSHHSDIKCYRCQGMGHYARECNVTAPNVTSCRRCGGKGHHAWECAAPAPIQPAPIQTGRFSTRQQGNGGLGIEVAPRAAQ